MGPEFEDLGLIDYERARSLQQDRLEARLRGEIGDRVLLVEHPPVITLGRGTEAGNVREAGEVPVVEVERGGDVTLHAPGQLVAYVIRLLPEGQRDLHEHLRLLEEIVIGTLSAFDVEGRRVPGKTGVWVGDRKIASIGVACRRWCTWHGLALNCDVDLRQFERINPCGFEASVMTSLTREIGRPVRVTEVVRELVAATRAAWPDAR